MDKSYSLLVSKSNPELLLDRISELPPGQLEAITTRLLFNASIIVLLHPSKKDGDINMSNFFISFWGNFVIFLIFTFFFNI